MIIISNTIIIVIITIINIINIKPASEIYMNDNVPLTITSTDAYSFIITHIHFSGKQSPALHGHQPAPN